MMALAVRAVQKRGPKFREIVARDNFGTPEVGWELRNQVREIQRVLRDQEAVEESPVGFRKDGANVRESPGFEP
jgi:hypothetical protein